MSKSISDYDRDIEAKLADRDQNFLQKNKEILALKAARLIAAEHLKPLAEIIHTNTCSEFSIQCGWSTQTWDDKHRALYLKIAGKLYEAFPDISNERVAQMYEIIRTTISEAYVRVNDPNFGKVISVEALTDMFPKAILEDLVKKS